MEKFRNMTWSNLEDPKSTNSLVTFMSVSLTKAENHTQNKLENIENSEIKKNPFSDLKIVEKSDSKKLQFSQNIPFRMESFLSSLKELEMQAKGYKRKKKSVRCGEKKIEATEMRDRIKHLMSNISRTLNDVDWYFSYEQIEKNKDKECCVSEATQKLVLKRMKEVDGDLSDVFVDSFVQQMYDLDPSILGKIDSRIESEFSSDEQLPCDDGLSSDAELSSDDDASNVKRPARLASTAKGRKANVRTVIKNEDPSYVDEIFPNDEMLTKIPNYLNNVNKIFKHKNIARLLAFEPHMRETTTSTESTTYENFYDYGDYYRESDEDKFRDVAHYEIVQDVLHSTSSIYKKDYDVGGGSYRAQIKNKNKKTRNFHKNKRVIKKRLKDKLEHFQSKTYKGHNIESDY